MGSKCGLLVTQRLLAGTDAPPSPPHASKPREGFVDPRAPDYPREPLPYVVRPASSAALHPCCMGFQGQCTGLAAGAGAPQRPRSLSRGDRRLALQPSEGEGWAELHAACAMGCRRTLL